MKKLLLTMFAACVMFAASAQVSIGAKAGLNLADFGGDAEGTEMLPAFHVGAYFNIGISDAFSLQPELLFNAVGAKITGEGDAKYALNYISIPVMFKYNLTENLNIQAGPQLGILASAKGKSDDVDVDIKDLFKATDFGLNVGVGVDFGKANVALRYSLGLSNIAEDSGDNKVTNNVIQVAFGYTLFGGK